MRVRVLVGSALAATLMVTATGGVARSAEPSGTGTAGAQTSVVRVALGKDGSVLKVRVLGDDGQAVTDGATNAYSRLAPLTISSATVPALNLDLPNLEAKQPGGSPSIQSPPVELPGPVGGGSIDSLNLSAAIGAATAKAGLLSGASTLSLAGGLVAVNQLKSSLGANSDGTSATSERAVSVGQITVLDLGSVLGGLGLPLDKLPIALVEDLLRKLGLPAPDLTQLTTQTQAAIQQLQTIIAGGGTVTAGAATTVTGAVGTIGGLLTPVTGGGGLLAVGLPPISLPPVGAPVEQLNQVIAQLQNALGGALGDALGALDDVALLSADGIVVGLTTRAGKTLADSQAAINAKIGSLSVGGVALPGLDLSATPAQLNGLVSGVLGKVSGVLGAVDPGLANIVSLKVLEQSRDVKLVNGYTTATAGITALTATITPPANLAAIVQKVTSLAAPVGAVLETLGGKLSLQALDLPVLSGTGGLTQALGGVSALAGGATVTVAEVAGSSRHRALAVEGSTQTPARPTTPVASGELPRTGGDPLVPVAVGLWLVVGGALLVERSRRAALVRR